jgi:hypothetical protein
MGRRAVHAIEGPTSVGISIGAGTYATPSMWLPSLRPVPLALGAGVAAGLGKELVDLARGGRFDWVDFGATVVGTLVGVGLSLAVSAVFAGPGR